MRKLFITLVVFCSYVYAGIPNMAVPGLTTYGYGNSEIRSHIPGFNSDVRGAIINSGRFKIMQMPRQDEMWRNGNVQTVLTALPSITLESSAIASESAVNKNMPDYILLGKVLSISKNQDSDPVEDTNKISKAYNIDIAVDYKLIKTSDKSIMASFTAYGHASDVKIFTRDSTDQVLHTNKPLLMQNASKSLAKDVLKHLYKQFNMSSENYDNGSRVITDVKVYSN